jgi:ferredoxin
MVSVSLGILDSICLTPASQNFTGSSNCSAKRSISSTGINRLSNVFNWYSRFIKKVAEETDASQIGFIFPVYAWGIPEIVIRFIKKLTIPENTYLFAIATCGGTPGGTIGQLNKLLKKKGKRLSAGFTVAYKSGNLGMENGLIKFVRKLAGPGCRFWEERVAEICRIIDKKENARLEQNNFQTCLIGNFFASTASKMLSKMDKNFSINKNCNGCGTCVKTCPVDNITLSEGRPFWNHQCQQCLACVHWCPQTAIEIGDTSRGKPRYHNPGITLQEMFSLKK